MSIQSDIDAAAAQGGGIVIIPAGRHVLTSQLVVKHGVILSGEGKVGYDYHLPGPNYGTILDIQWGMGPNTSGNPASAAIIMQAGSALIDMGFDYSLQLTSASSPVEYGSTVQLYDLGQNNYNITVKDCYFFKSFIAIDARASKGGTGSSNLTISGCQGVPLYAGIAVDGITDWQAFENCNFNAGLMSPGSKAGLVAWCAEYGRGLLIGGNDWAQFRNIQVFGYGVGAQIRGQDGYGGSGPYTFDGCQFDGCPTGINLGGTILHPVKVLGCSFAPYQWVTGAFGAALNNSGGSLQGLQFANNYVFGPALFAVHLSGDVRDVLIAGNIARTQGSAGSAYTVIGGNNVQIVNNIATGFAAPTYTVGSTNVIVRDNQT